MYVGRQKSVICTPEFDAHAIPAAYGYSQLFRSLDCCEVARLFSTALCDDAAPLAGSRVLDVVR